MKRIRTKMIVILLGIALLPVFPIVWLVNDLVRQSYQVGVNRQVEEALQKGVEFSRELYQLRKEHLSSRLAALAESAALLPAGKGLATAGAGLLPEDDAEWRYRAVQIYDRSGKLLYQESRDSAAVLLSRSQLEQLQENAPQRLVIAQRRENQFIAIERQSGSPEGYLVLQAALPADFLEGSNQSLQIYQMYRTLALTPVSVPRSLLSAFLLMIGVIVLATVGIALWLSQRLTRPLGALVRGTEEIGRGNLDYRIPPARNDEIGELIGHFNRMAGELKNYQEKTIYLEKMAAWQEIARRLAHEIKNPLTPIQLTVQQMVDQYPGGDENYRQLVQECHTIINEEIENLRRLVREFSDFGRLPQLELQEGDLNGLIREVSRLFAGRPIELRLSEDLPPLPMDADRLRRVLINLLQNADQADPQRHPIIISTQIRQGMAEVSIADQGSGIAPELLPKVFEPYFSTRTNGIGLGLAITRKMVEEHDGRIRVESVPGRGSTFTFSLPLKRVE